MVEKIINKALGELFSLETISQSKVKDITTKLRKEILNNPKEKKRNEKF